MKREIVVLVGLASLAVGCATIRSGDYGVPVDAANRPQASRAATGPAALMISAGEVSRYSSPYLGLVEVTFENNTPAWIQIDQLALDFGSPARNQSVMIPSGDDIADWERAVTVRDVVEAANRATALEVFALVGSIGALGGGHHRHAAVASAAAAGALDAEAAQAVGVPEPPSYSDQHLLSTPIRIPPGLFTKRWVLLYTAANPLGGCIDSMILSYQTHDQAKGRVLLPFKSRASPWQHVACIPMYQAGREQ